MSGQVEKGRQALQVLLIEDSEDDAILLMDHLQSELDISSWRRVETEPELRDAMEQHWDIVFSDYTMPRFSGSDALQILREFDPDIPFIFVSGTIGEQSAVEAMKSGAQDYVMKDDLPRLLPAVSRELRDARSRREHRMAQDTVDKLSLVVKQAADSVFITDPQGVFEYVNPAFERLTGYSPDEVKGATPAILCSGMHDKKFYRELWKTILKGEVFHGTLINRRKNGDLFYEEKIISPLKDGKQAITHFVSTGRDITERVYIEEARSRLIAILEATPDMVAILNPDGCLRYLNGSGRRLLGMNKEDVCNDYCLPDMFPERVTRHLVNDVLPAAQRNGQWSGESVMTLPDGTELPVSLVILAHFDKNANLEFVSAIARDISDRKCFEAELQRQATHDRLTGLPNRYFLISRLKSELENARRNSSYVAVIFIDLDNFKRVNDTLGHVAGDTFLQQVAQRLRSCLRPNDIVARHGGDEFTIAVSDLDSEENVLAVLRNLRMSFDRSVVLGSHEIYVTFSAGIAIYPHDGQSVEDLLRNADTAMYRAKASGSNQYRFYAPDMNVRGHELLTLEADLRLALERDEFKIYYQPQVNLSSGRMIGAEGLIQWKHATRGLLGPMSFIPMLENSGLIVDVGEWVIHQACAIHREWAAMGHPQLRVSVNVSAAQFSDDYLLNKIKYAIHDENMDPRCLELEITENIVMQDPTNAIEILSELNSLGVRTAIDDFGTGYSSLAYLKRFPINVLKIDQTFVGDLCEDANDAVIVEASISLAQKLGLEVVAEGVETNEQIEFLLQKSCDILQGYYISRSVPANNLRGMFNKHWQWGYRPGA